MIDISNPARGNRLTLTADETALLEGKILPTAREWLAIPGLKQHGMQTLMYWGEEIPEKYRKRSAK